IPSFPLLAEDPKVEQITLREPAIMVGVKGPEGDSVDAALALREVAESVRKDLLNLPSVSQANILGSPEYQVDIEIPESTLRKYGLTLQQVASIVRRENIELPGGTLKSSTQEVLLRSKNKRLIGSEIGQIPLISDIDGVVLTVDDLGNVRDEFTDDAAISEIDGQPGLAISIDAAGDEDLLNIAEEVREYVKQHPRVFERYSLVYWRDSSVDVQDRMNLLVRNGLQGLGLVFIVLAVFLELRLAFWVAMGIPVAVLGSGIYLWMTGETLNMLSMFAFLMALGIVVDDAIVIGENIYAHRQRGKATMQAAIDGAWEVLPSVAASVGTTMITFAPLLFVSGIMGKFIAVMPVAVIAMLAISLIECMTILPCHLSHEKNLFLDILGFLLYPLRPVGALFRWLNRCTERGLHFFVERLYAPSLGWVLRRPEVCVSVAVMLLLVVAAMFKSGSMKWELMPPLDSNWIEAKVTFPDGTPLEVTDAATQQIEKAIYEIGREYGKKENGKEGNDEEENAFIKIVHRRVGESSTPGMPGPDGLKTGSHVGTVFVEMVPSHLRSRTSEEITNEWRERVEQQNPDWTRGVEQLTFGQPTMGPGGTAVELKLLAPTEQMAELEAAVEDTKEALAKIKDAVDVRDDSQPGKWEYQLKVKDRALAMGVTAADLAETVRASYYGEEVMRLQRGRHEVKLMVRYPKEDRKSLADFNDIRVRGGDGVERPLTELAETEVETGYSEIDRLEQMRAITVTADVSKTGNSRDVTELLDDHLQLVINGKKRIKNIEELRDLEAEEAKQGDPLAANAWRNWSRRLQLYAAPFTSQKVYAEVTPLYPSVELRWEGQRKDTGESLTSLFVGFGIALLGMYVLLTLEFRSYLQPFLIMGIIPFGFIGAVFGHALRDMSFTLFSMFGLVALTGVVVNDSIVLIDCINQRIQEGLPLFRALIEAGKRRFRPVLLTSVTTVAGLLPLLMETSFQAQVLIPMAVSMAFGLMLATVLVLYLVPVYYSLYGRYVGLGGEDDSEPPVTPSDPVEARVERKSTGKPESTPVEVMAATGKNLAAE
ncbi:MAG TPA: AcrB/AcrD/AcrF family protein, partial [Planctomycetaceae bacterium]|nr:AcrB/AcrD/AcrF family protein [Planctomycetaceae bacterium]